MNDHLTPPPLSQLWERAAMKELCEIAYGLSHGLFEDYQDLCDRLMNTAETIRQLHQIYEIVPPSSHPEVNQLEIRDFIS